MKNKIVSFLWQHLLLLVSLYIMTLGVVVCVRSQFGSSVISTIPYVMQMSGVTSPVVPNWSIGQYTILMNGIFVLCQFLILRRRFEAVQLFQLVVGFFFGMLIDFNLMLTSWIEPVALWYKALAQVAGCTILGIGISFEIRCGSVTMPGEGITIAIHKVSGIPFAKAKIIVDVTLVTIAVALSYLLFGFWQWSVVGVGTLFAMIYVGIVVHAVSNHTLWFVRLLNYRPGFRRYIYGLARYIHS